MYRQSIGLLQKEEKMDTPQTYLATGVLLDDMLFFSTLISQATEGKFLEFFVLPRSPASWKTGY